jgi:3-methyl-2-oxobutanoate hydroxymethyltransferase
MQGNLKLRPPASGAGPGAQVYWRALPTAPGRRHPEHRKERCVVPKLTVADLQQMKRDQQKIAVGVCYDYQMAQILDRAGADMVSVGDSVGVRFYGQPTQFETTMEQMITCCLAVSHGVERAVVNCDLPFGPVQEGPQAAVRAAIRLMKEGRAEMVKVDAAADNIEATRAITRAGIPVWAQFGFTPQTTARFGGFTNINDEVRRQMKDVFVEQAKLLEDAGVSALDCTNMGNELLVAIAAAVRIPAIAGFNGGPAADGRVTVSYGVVGYGANVIDHPVTGRANVGRIIFDEMSKYFAAVRDGTAAP